jgi:hypothetical protein
MTPVDICAPDPIRVRKIIRYCFTCKRRRAMLLEAYEWYDPDVTCLTCGDSWTCEVDGLSRRPRPARAGWRDAAVHKARQRLKGAQDSEQRQ